MKLDPTITRETIETLLLSQSELVYGAERTQEIAHQITHISTMLEEIAHSELDLRDAAPDTRGIAERSIR